ncbi:MAG: carbamate kinase [Candidatus Thalassarchaeaceae archaeon]|jgi:carbamate kinase|nr:carbamate kinase [Euryarchaeota archaeon]MDP6220388.1 carbamate kinase [Candidatus Thalassarchaeaceae archaeon]MDP7091801.1 carbamate kinase [Candidatus Thalassarchaeaceae archaeon]MDP7257364.1 carbamate kinase [Candidatus Thalassarchaeaceae archaeon]MDP7446718.1 carbamate kinase [Candidatus Thalassarchaeaceae archaeon]|tara:strand:+ start:1655 stop:2563 length:909 start_codon:yes stop_codon:yes gene_type:complete
MRVVVALGGNALLRRGESLTAENQRKNVRIACRALAPLALEHQMVITHGNGPQVGLLALQSASYEEVDEYPLDVLGAQTEGMIGYMIQQELGNLLPMETAFATILTMVEVDPEDPAFNNPTKPIGPGYCEEDARRLAEEKGWTVARDGEIWRRVVPSPEPHRIFELRPIHWLLEKSTIVICAGGGGIPTVYNSDGGLEGVEVVIDKDRASALLARQLDARLLILATDADGVYLDWGTDEASKIESTTPEEIERYDFDVGSMGPKVEAACDFVLRTGERAVIGSLSDLGAMVAGEAGTQFTIE